MIWYKIYCQLCDVICEFSLNIDQKFDLLLQENQNRLIRIRRDGGGCGSGLEIFAFLLFLVIIGLNYCVIKGHAHASCSTLLCSWNQLIIGSIRPWAKQSKACAKQELEKDKSLALLTLALCFKVLLCSNSNMFQLLIIVHMSYCMIMFEWIFIVGECNLNLYILGMRNKRNSFIGIRYLIF